MQPTPDPGAAHAAVRSPRLLNATALLRACADGEPFTATAAMERTGLTRSTVLGLCEDLCELGWFRELPDARSTDTYQKGRPARRYAFDPDAARVVGIDAGQHRIAVSVADLTGNVLHTGHVTIPDDVADQIDRRQTVLDLLTDTLAETPGDGSKPILAVVAGIPAPVSVVGDSPPDGGFWPRMNAGIGAALTAPGRVVRVENDANLAAVAERSAGVAVDVSSFATLLSGVRFGAGLIVDDNLLHGDGGAGELRLLQLVMGVEGADGLARVAREELHRAISQGEVEEHSPLRAATAEGHEVEVVLREARVGDPVAQRIADGLADRLARVCAVVATMLGLELVVVAGALAPALGPLVAEAQERLTQFSQPPLPRLEASSLGGDVVLAGALHQAHQLVWADPLSFSLEPTG